MCRFRSFALSAQQALAKERLLILQHKVACAVWRCPGVNDAHVRRKKQRSFTEKDEMRKEGNRYIVVLNPGADKLSDGHASTPLGRICTGSLSIVSFQLDDLSPNHRKGHVTS